MRRLRRKAFAARRLRAICLFRLALRRAAPRLAFWSSPNTRAWKSPKTAPSIASRCSLAERSPFPAGPPARHPGLRTVALTNEADAKEVHREESFRSSGDRANQMIATARPARALACLTCRSAHNRKMARTLFAPVIGRHAQACARTGSAGCGVTGKISPHSRRIAKEMPMNSRPGKMYESKAVCELSGRVLASNRLRPAGPARHARRRCRRPSRIWTRNGPKRRRPTTWTARCPFTPTTLRCCRRTRPSPSAHRLFASIWATFLVPGNSVSWEASKVEVARSSDLAYSTGVYQETGKDPQGKTVIGPRQVPRGLAETGRRQMESRRRYLQLRPPGRLLRRKKRRSL